MPKYSQPGHGVIAPSKYLMDLHLGNRGFIRGGACWRKVYVEAGVERIGEGNKGVEFGYRELASST